MTISQFVYTFPGWWTFGLYPVWGYHRWNCHEISYSNIFEEIWFELCLGKFLRVKFLGLMVSVSLTFKETVKKSFKMVELLINNEWGMSAPVLPYPLKY